MKALQSEFAKRILRDPESARALSLAAARARYHGPEHGVVITVHPIKDDGRRGDPVRVNVHIVPKAY